MRLLNMPTILSPPPGGKDFFLVQGGGGRGRGHNFKSFLKVKGFKKFMFNDLGFKGNLIAVSSREW